MSDLEHKAGETDRPERADGITREGEAIETPKEAPDVQINVDTPNKEEESK